MIFKTYNDIYKFLSEQFEDNLIKIYAVFNVSRYFDLEEKHCFYYFLKDEIFNVQN